MTHETEQHRRKRTGPAGSTPGRDLLLERAVAEEWTLQRLERVYILRLLARHDGHRGRTAQALGIDRRTLYRKLKAYRAEEIRKPSEYRAADGRDAERHERQRGQGAPTQP
jgi:DNA-binding NtrC family response regulator